MQVPSEQTSPAAQLGLQLPSVQTPSSQVEPEAQGTFALQLPPLLQVRVAVALAHSTRPAEHVAVMTTHSLALEHMRPSGQSRSCTQSTQIPAPVSQTSPSPEHCRSDAQGGGGSSQKPSALQSWPASQSTAVMQSTQ